MIPDAVIDELSDIVLLYGLHPEVAVAAVVPGDGVPEHGGGVTQVITASNPDATFDTSVTKWKVSDPSAAVDVMVPGEVVPFPVPTNVAPVELPLCTYR